MFRAGKVTGGYLLHKLLVILVLALVSWPISEQSVNADDLSPSAANPDALRVASGDTTQEETVLWARTDVVGVVTFEVATNTEFGALTGVYRGFVHDVQIPPKILVGSLMPNTQYFYRVTDAGAHVRVGRFRTAAAPGTRVGLQFGVSGDWRGELAPFVSVRNAIDADLHFFVELGDTIDHEVINDFAGGAPISSDSRFNGDPEDLINDSALYENGFRAFQAYNPLRDEFYGQTGDPRTAQERKLYRHMTYGDDAAVFLLDARSFRDTELPFLIDPTDLGGIRDFLEAAFDPTRTMLGQQQLEDLKRDMQAAESAGITWKFIFVAEPIQNLGFAAAADRFEGYAAERSALLKFINEEQITNVVFVAADIHGTLVNNLTYQERLGGRQVATGAFEITTGSVAFDAPLGPTSVRVALEEGILPPAQGVLYDSLPVQPDRDRIADDKDDYLRKILNAQLAILGYDPIGLNHNLAYADGMIDAQLLRGDYISVHYYGWTEFTVDADSRQLRVVTYGILPYTVAELEAMPGEVLAREPVIVSEFVVNPQPALLDRPAPAVPAMTRTGFLAMIVLFIGILVIYGKKTSAGKD